MKIAILGAGGQLAKDLEDVFETVVPLRKDDLDVTKKDDIEQLREIQPDVVINTAAYHSTDECEHNPQKTFAVNATGSLNVARMCNEIDAVYVFISTDYVFDGKKNKPYTEDDCPSPLNVYGASKVAGEQFARAYADRHYVIRTSSLFGAAGAEGKGGNFVEAMLEQKAQGNDIQVIDNIEMSPTYTEDLSRAIKEMLDNDLPYGTYHITNAGSCSWYGFTQQIFDVLGKDVDLTAVTAGAFDRDAARPSYSVLATEKLADHGIEMRSWQDAVEAYLRETGRLT